jgi:hypothetical protein
MLKAKQTLWKEFVFQFPSLRRITLHFYGYELNDETIMEPMTAFLEANKEKFVSGKAPEVVYLEV